MVCAALERNEYEMRREKIEFSLVGAIFVLILFIGAIVCAVKFVPKIFKGKPTENVVLEDKTNEVDEQIEMLEVVNINGADELVMMKNCKGSFNYVMKYDPNKFSIEKNVDGKDVYKIINSDGVYIDISVVEADFEAFKTDLLNNNVEGLGRDIGVVEEITINSINALKETFRDENTLNIKYYIKKGNGYYVLNEVSNTESESNINPIIDKMISSFSIL